MGKTYPQTMFNGQLNTNELYNAIFNMIISQRIFDTPVAEPSLANRLKVDGTLYGDTKTYYSMDIGACYDWGNDAEAPKLLELNRNNTQQVQKITLDRFKQANITVDNYLSKRAWGSEGVFGQFNGVLTASIGQVKKVFENGYINTFIGTNRSDKALCNIEVDRSDIVVPTTTVEMEATARISGQRISKAIADLFVQLRDNSRDFNEYGFLRAYDPAELLVVWNAEAKNTITHLDLPMIFNNGTVQPIAGMEMPSKYFGDAIKVAGTSTGVQRAIKERIYYTDAINGTIAPMYIRGGELLPTGYKYDVDEAYTPDPTVVAKIISVEGNPFMSSMEVGTAFFNARSLTENHYLTWGFNTMQNLKEKPLITINLGEMTN